jgi:hypothetical protein
MVDDTEPPATDRVALWCMIQASPLPPHSPIPEVLTVSVEAFARARDKQSTLLGFLDELMRRSENARGSYVYDLLGKLAQAVSQPRHGSRPKEDHDAAAVKALAGQLLEIEDFNKKLHAFYTSQPHPALTKFMHPFQANDATAPELTFWETGAIADRVAQRMQETWQGLMLGATEDLAEKKGFFSLFFSWPPGLVRLGLMGALMLACFTEFHDGCEVIDYFAVFQCDGPIWKAWVGVISLITYMVVLAWGWWQYIGLKAKKVENKHQDYRLLAEYMRVQYVWAVLGIRRGVTETEPAAVSSESGWVVSAARALKHHADMPDTSLGQPSEASVRWAKEEFLIGQRDYHDKKLISRRKLAFRRIRRSGRVAVVSSIVSFTLLFLFELGEAFFEGLRHLDMAAHVMTLILLISLAVWATMHKVIDLYAWEIESQRGTLVRSALQKAIDDLTRGQEPVRSVFLKCGRFFCIDQAAWHALRRAKPIEVPSGG